MATLPAVVKYLTQIEQKRDNVVQAVQLRHETVLAVQILVEVLLRLFEDQSDIDAARADEPAVDLDDQLVVARQVQDLGFSNETLRQTRRARTNVEDFNNSLFAVH